jgi:hypothetical protein
MAASMCIVTVHGIGFQQPPVGDRPGYADALHANLRHELNDRLGDDPERGERGGPVYVSSEWKGSPQKGLARLAPDCPLAAEGKIAHVALVYAPSEPLEPRLGSVTDVLARAMLAHNTYTSAVGALRLVFADAWAALHEHHPATAQSTLRPRQDQRVHGLVSAILHGHRQPEQSTSAGSAEGSPQSDPGAFGTLRALEDDLATYVARNDLRERVRSFVEEALLSLLDRDDIGGLIVNAHSQGTVICWDVLCRLPFLSWAAEGDRRAMRVCNLVTAGSPIRKYVDMFAWGDQVGQMAALVGDESGPMEKGGVGSTGFAWHNFWDRHDPVADPLNPPAAWRPGGPLDERPDGDDGLLVSLDPSGAERHVSVHDAEVDNVLNTSGGGLQAHDYWSNAAQFVPALARLAGQALP